MEMQELHHPHRQRSLESQRSDQVPIYPNMQAQRQPLYRQMAARLRVANTGLRRGSRVDDALAAVAERHEGGDRFLKDYAQISHRGQTSLHKIFDLFVREPLAADITAGREDFSSARYKILANWLDWVHNASNPEKEDTFVMCSCTAENVQLRTEVFYWLLAIMPGQVRRIKGIPRRALAYLLCREPGWKISDDLASDIAEATENFPQVMDNRASLPFDGLPTYHPYMTSATIAPPLLQNSTPPSLRSQVSLNSEVTEARNRDSTQDPNSIAPHPPDDSVSMISARCSNTVNDDSASRSETSGVVFIPTEFVLFWQSKPPGYSRDFDIYIWQPYRKPAPFNYVKFHIIHNETSRNLKMILLFNDVRSLCAFRTRHEEITNQRDAAKIQLHVVEVMRSVSALFRMILLDMVEFLQCVSNEVAKLTFESRIHPRVEKIQYLIHMNDRRERAQLDMERNKEQLNKAVEHIKSLMPTTHQKNQVTTALGGLAARLDHVRKELGSLGTAINTLQKEIEFHNSLQTRNSSLLTFLAAIYIPIAFATSFLGMNVTEMSTTLIPGLSSSPSNSSQSNGTQSNSTLPDGSDSGPTQHLWDLRWFPLLSAPLLFATIILPLTFGPFIRWLAQMYLKFRKFWRCVIIALMVAYLIAYYLTDNNVLVNYILLTLCDATVLFIGVYRLIRAMIIKEKRVMWFVFVIISVGCTLVDEIVREPLLVGQFAWIILTLMFFVSYGYFELFRRWVLSFMCIRTA